MRQISPVSITKLLQKKGGEPVIIVGIQWADLGYIAYYADKFINEQIKGRILDIGELDQIINISLGSNSVSINITLNDTDNELKSIFNTSSFHNCPVFVFQWFTDLPLSEAILLFDGIVASPIEWNEGDRTLSFAILSRIADNEIGYNITGNNKKLPENVGDVIKKPTVVIDEYGTATTLIDIGIPDHSLGQQLNYIQYTHQEQMAKAGCYSRVGAHLKFLGNTAGGGRELFVQGQQYERQAQNIYKGIAQQVFSDLSRLTIIQQTQRQQDVDVIPIQNGKQFVQNKEIEIQIKEAYYIGNFVPDADANSKNATFHVTSRRGPNDPVNRRPKVETAVFGHTVLIQDTQENADKKHADFLFRGPQEPTASDNTRTTNGNGDPCSPPNFLFVPTTQPASLDPPKSNGYYSIPAGAEVRAGKGNTVRHVVSANGTSGGSAPIVYGRSSVGVIPPISNLPTLAEGLAKIYAERAAAAEALVVIPPELYTVTSETYDNIVTTLVTLNQPLSTIPGSNWTDEIYYSLQGTIGSNIVDVLIYLIQKYTIFNIDSESFELARSQCAVLKCGFVLDGTQGVITLLKDIAYQGACFIWLKYGVFYIKCLAFEGSPVDALTEADIVENSLVITTTATEDLITVINAQWQGGIIILRYNIAKYGINTEDTDYKIFTDYQSVAKTATFWIYRKANVWKILKCKAFISKLGLETMDHVLLNFIHPWVANEPVIGLIQRAVFNATDYTIDLEIWVPVILGEMSKSNLAYTNFDISIVPLPLPPPVVYNSATIPRSSVFVGNYNQQITPPIASNPNAVDQTKNFSIESQNINTFGLNGRGTNAGSQGEGTSVIPTGGFGVNAPIYGGLPKTFDTKNNQYQKPPPFTTVPTLATLPGKIVSKRGVNSDGSIEYNVLLYELGLDDAPTEIVAAQLIHDINDEIPKDTMAMISRTIYYNAKIPVIKYYMQLPVWIGGDGFAGATGTFP